MAYFAPKREYYVPKGARKVSARDLPAGACAYVYELESIGGRIKYVAMCFRPKAQKPTAHYNWPTAAKREAYVAQFFQGIRDHEQRVQERRAKANAGHNWEPGLILYGSWGYDQTNIDFYEVVKVVGKTMVEIVELGSQRASDAPNSGFSSMSDHVVPDPEQRGKKTFRVKVSSGSCKSPKYGCLWVWDGKPRYCSWYA